MNIQVFPNWTKKIAITVFIISYIISYSQDAINALKEGYNASNSYEINNNNSRYINNVDEKVNVFEEYLGHKAIHIFKFLTLLSMLVYLMSREKVEDDFIKILRLEAFQLTAIIFIIGEIVFFLFDESIKYRIGDFASDFLTLYLLIFFIKKRIY